MTASLYVQNKNAWIKYNQSRVDRAFEINQEKSRLAFHVIPFLLQRNDPDLPGYIEGNYKPVGISRYAPDKGAMESVRRSFPRINLNKLLVPNKSDRAIIESLLLMGSIGAVGHNLSSDHDYWVVVDEKLFLDDEIKALKKKLKKLEEWAETKKTEIHFFFSDVNKVRVNDFGETDKESAGSSQAAILKEEFYRTMILLYGKLPMWLAFPPGVCEAEYEEHKELMLDEGHFGKDDVVDLGPACVIPVEELFGGLLWQFNKAMESPNKSVLKMALLESYLMAGSKSELLCDTLKRSIQEETQNPEDFDPYILMIDYIRKYYRQAKRGEDLLKIEKCFFLKCFDSPIKSLDIKQNLPYKERALRTCIRGWGWSLDTLMELNHFTTWDSLKAEREASAQHSYMLETYKRLTDTIATQANVKSAITDSDLTVLGRKLFTLYAKKPGKVEFLKRMKNETELLDSITYAAVFARGQKPLWTVYRENIVSQMKKGMSVDRLALKSARDPVILMLWLTLNRVYGGNTFLYFVPNQTPLSLKDVQRLMERIFALFPPVVLKDLAQQDLLTKANVTKIMVVVNLLEQRWEKDIKTFHILYANSWGEAYCEIGVGSAATKKLLDILNQTKSDFSISDQTHFHIFIPEGDSQGRLSARIKSFLAEKYNPFIRASDKPS